MMIKSVGGDVGCPLLKAGSALNQNQVSSDFVQSGLETQQSFSVNLFQSLTCIFVCMSTRHDGQAIHDRILSKIQEISG